MTVQVPHDLAAERAVLGSVLLEPGSLYRIINELTPEDFYRIAHQKIFAAMMALAEIGNAVTLESLNDQCAGDPPTVEIAGLADAIPDFIHIENHANIVRKHAILRGILDASGGMIQRARAPGADPVELLDQLEAGVTALAARSRRRGFETVAAAGEKIITELEGAKLGHAPAALYTGFRSLDNLLIGLRPGNLCYLGARQGMGKSALAMAIAVNIARQGKRVAFMSLEMTTAELVVRMLCSECGINLQAALKHDLKPADFAALGKANLVTDLPILIDDTPSASALDIRGKCRRMKMEQGLDIVIVDHVHIMRPCKARRTRNDELGEISRGLKMTAKELNVPVIAVAQLNRELEKQDRKKDRKPRVSDLRESGNLEQDADLILLLYREDFYREDHSLDNGVAEVKVGKQRQGPTGTATLRFYKNLVRFEDVEHQMIQASMPPSGRDAAAGE